MLVLGHIVLGVILFFLQLCLRIKGVPTHHLTIGVQGSTPTLIVTSIDKDEIILQQHQQHQQHPKGYNNEKKDIYKDKMVETIEMVEKIHINDAIPQRRHLSNRTHVDLITNSTNAKDAQLFPNDTLKLTNNNRKKNKQNAIVKERKDKKHILSKLETTSISKYTISRNETGPQHHQQQHQHQQQQQQQQYFHQNYHYNQENKKIVQPKTLTVIFLPTTSNKEIDVLVNLPNYTTTPTITTTNTITTNNQYFFNLKKQHNNIYNEKDEIAPTDSKATKILPFKLNESNTTDKRIIIDAATTTLKLLNGNMFPENIEKPQNLPFASLREDSKNDLKEIGKIKLSAQIEKTISNDNNNNIGRLLKLTRKLASEMNPIEQTTTETAFLIKLLDVEGINLKTNFSEHMHNKGHDGLKITKKKQLKDKHFLDTLYSTEQFNKTRHSSNNSTISATSVMSRKISNKPIQLSNLGPTKIYQKVFNIRQITTTTKPSTAISSTIPTGKSEKLSKTNYDTKTKTLSSNNSLISIKKLNTSLLSTTIFEILKPKFINAPLLQKPKQQKTVEKQKQQSQQQQQQQQQQQKHNEKQKKNLQPSETMFTMQENFNETITQIPLNEKTESKISNIQIEVYDSTMDSTIEDSNFTNNTLTSNVHPHHAVSMQSSGIVVNRFDGGSSTIKPSRTGSQQERFTQYVIDRSETSTPQSLMNLTSIYVESGKPEPAAIEIHINVSEAFNELNSNSNSNLNSNSNNDNIDFSQGENYNVNAPIGSETFYEAKNINNIQLKALTNLAAITKMSQQQIQEQNLNHNYNNINNNDYKHNENDGYNRNSNNDRINQQNGEILLIEIINTGDNINSNKSHDFNRTFFNDNDELFMANMNIKLITTRIPPLAASTPSNKDVASLEEPFPFLTLDRNSDTIFYISNTKVKVGESLPTTVQQQQQQQQQQRKMNLKSQFFPIEYTSSTPQSGNINDNDDNIAFDSSASDNSMPSYHMYKEDIILSKNNHNQANTLKMFHNRSNSKNVLPLDITYVGESIIDAKEKKTDNNIILNNDRMMSMHLANQTNHTPDIIMQSATLPDISIGVPVIGELPPQIELKAIDVMPNQLTALEASANQTEIQANTYQTIRMNSKRNILTEPSLQYGRDIIDEGANNGFDGVESSYPFVNPNDLTKKRTHATDYTHYTIDNGISNMRKNILSADIKEPIEEEGKENFEWNTSNNHNITTKDYRLHTNHSFLNFNYTIIETLERNATLFSIMEESSKLLDQDEDIVNLLSLIIGVFIIILPLIVSTSLFCVLRYVYHKYQLNMMNINNGKANKRCSFENDKKLIEENKNAIEQSALSALSISSSPLSSTPTSFSLNRINKHNSIQKEALDTITATSTFNKPPFIVPLNQEHQHYTINNAKQENDALTNNSHLTNNSECQLSVSYLPSAIINSIKKLQQDNNLKTNGSITKMTLENNILIVETEERNDISRVARETKMDYHKDGIFVIEVARGIDSKTIPTSPITNSDERILQQQNHCKLNGNIGGYTISKEKHCHIDKNVQIHSAPIENDEYNKNFQHIEEIEEPSDMPPMINMNDKLPENKQEICTGLSQSDLSSTSSDNINEDYVCGKQEIYMIDTNNEQKIQLLHNANVNMKSDLLLASITKSNNNLQDNSSTEIEHIMLNGPTKYEIRNPCQNEIPEKIPDILCNTLTADNFNGNFIDLPSPPSFPSINENLNNNLISSNTFCNKLSEISQTPPPPPPPLNDNTDLHITTNGDMVLAPLTPPASPPTPSPPLHCFHESDGTEVQLKSAVNATYS